MNAKRAKKYNMRRKFFNNHETDNGVSCNECGSKFVTVTRLDETVVSTTVCPLQDAHQ